MIDAVLRHAFLKRLKVVIIALFPIGSVTMAEQEVSKVGAEYADTNVYGVDYVNSVLFLTFILFTDNNYLINDIFSSKISRKFKNNLFKSNW